MPKVLATSALLLALALAGLFLWARSRLLIVRHELSASSGVLRLDPREDVDEWRKRIAQAVHAASLRRLTAPREPLLNASLILKVDRRNWRLGWPPWISTATVDFALPCSLAFEPGPPAAWTAGFGGFLLQAPLSREEAVEVLLGLITEQLRRNRAELDRLR